MRTVGTQGGAKTRSLPVKHKSDLSMDRLRLIRLLEEEEEEEDGTDETEMTEADGPRGVELGAASTKPEDLFPLLR